MLTASSVMERPVAVIGPEAGPRTAHRLMREPQTSALLVVSRDRRVQGIVWEDDVAEALRKGSDNLPPMSREVSRVSPDTQLADLFADSASSRAPLAVVQEDGVLVGLIPRVTLLTALADPGTSGDDLETSGGAR